MRLYPLFLLLAATTVLIPGPGVVMTLTNALRSGYRGSIGGILGIALGAVVLATISASSLGLVLAQSPDLFRILRYVGAAYLAYLGTRLWFAPVTAISGTATDEIRIERGFVEGLGLQLTNPKPILFFILVIPQFTDTRNHFPGQVAILALTYSALVVLVHSIYALVALRARRWLVSDRLSRACNWVGGAVFVALGLLLVAAQP